MHDICQSTRDNPEGIDIIMNIRFCRNAQLNEANAAFAQRLIKVMNINFFFHSNVVISAW